MAAQAVRPLPQPAVISPRVHLIHKLLLLENARNTMEEELRHVTNKAYEDVRGFLSASCPRTGFIDLCKGLDVKCQLIQTLSALLKGLMVEPKVDFLPTVKNEVRTNQVQPLKVKDILMTDVVKFEPKLRSSYMASSITKMVQVLRQLKPFFTWQPAAVQQHDMTSAISSNLNSAVLTTVSRCSSKTEEEQVVCDENRQPDSGTAPPVITLRQEISAERPQLLPPIQVILPEISNPKPPLISSGREGAVQVQRQKQTSTQLLHYLKEKPKNTEAFVTGWTKSTYGSDYPQPISPVVTTQNDQIRHTVTDYLEDTLSLRTPQMNPESQAPVFKVKQVESSGLMAYQCVITTGTEVWDIGDVLVEGSNGGSEPGPPEHDDCRDVAAQMDTSHAKNGGKTHTVECTEARRQILSGAKMQPFNSVNIPQFLFRRFEEAEVVVSHVVHPGEFYIQRTDSPEKLQSVIIDSWKASSSYAEQNCIPDLGTRVMGWSSEQKQWCRAQVMKICGVSRDGSEMSIQVEVKRLDYGDTMCLSLRNVKEMTPEMASVPLQALQVSLTDVTPVNGSHWSEESLAWFKAAVHNRTFYARFYPQGPKVTVELFLEKGNSCIRRSAPLSLRLAQSGHAVHDEVKNAAAVNRRVPKRFGPGSNQKKYVLPYYFHNKK